MFKPKTPISGRLEIGSGERIRYPFGALTLALRVMSKDPESKSSWPDFWGFGGRLSNSA